MIGQKKIIGKILIDRKNCDQCTVQTNKLKVTSDWSLKTVVISDWSMKKIEIREWSLKIDNQ